MSDLLRLLQTLQQGGQGVPQNDFPAPLHPAIMEQRNLLRGDPMADAIFQQAYGGQDNVGDPPQMEQARHPGVERFAGGMMQAIGDTNYRPRNFGEGLLLGGLQGAGGAIMGKAGEREASNAEKKAAYKAQQKAAFEQKQMAQKQYGDMAMKAREEANKPKPQTLEEKLAEQDALIRGRVVSTHKAYADNNIPRYKPEPAIGEFSPEAVAFLAGQYSNYGVLPPRGILTNPQGRAIIETAAGTPGANPAAGKADLQANMGSLVQQQKSLDAVRVFKKMTKANADQLKFRAKKVLDAGSPLLNKPLREIDASVLGSADMAAYRTAMQVVIPEYQRLLNNPNLTGVLTVDARHEMEKAVNDGLTYPQLIKALEVLDIDGLARVKSLEEGVKEIKARIRNPFGGDGSGAPAGNVVKWDIGPDGKPVKVVQ